MNITYKIDLDKYFPNEIIELHQQGVITLDEIIASGRIHSCFSDDLRKYVNTQRKLEIAAMPETVVMSTPYEDLQPTRIVTRNDRFKFVELLDKKGE